MRTIHNAMRYLFLGVLAVILAMTGGCKKKTPQVPPPQAQAPSTTTPAEKPPAQPPAETQPSTSSEPTNTGGTATTPAEKPPETATPSKPSSGTEHIGRRNHRTSTKSKPAAPKSNAPATPSAQTQQSPTKTPSSPATQTQQSAAKTSAPPAPGTGTGAPPAQPNPATAPPPSPTAGNSQITPGMSPVDEVRTKQATTQMIDSCEAGLKGLNRNLSDEEKTTLSNIRNFITQSRAALTDGEFELAHNYASKAHQLCDELVKH